MSCCCVTHGVRDNVTVPAHICAFFGSGGQATATRGGLADDDLGSPMASPTSAPSQKDCLMLTSPPSSSRGTWQVFDAMPLLLHTCSSVCWPLLLPLNTTSSSFQVIYLCSLLDNTRIYLLFNANVRQCTHLLEVIFQCPYSMWGGSYHQGDNVLS
jgi:hypothetical protein